jgi:hypothetical protein
MTAGEPVNCDAMPKSAVSGIELNVHPSGISVSSTKIQLRN